MKLPNDVKPNRNDNLDDYAKIYVELGYYLKVIPVTSLFLQIV